MGSTPIGATMTDYKLQELEQKLVKLNEWIENYKPPTKWEAENCRMLKCLKIRRKALEKAIDRHIERYGTVDQWQESPRSECGQCEFESHPCY